MGLATSKIYINYRRSVAPIQRLLRDKRSALLRSYFGQENYYVGSALIMARLLRNINGRGFLNLSQCWLAPIAV